LKTNVLQSQVNLGFELMLSALAARDHFLWIGNYRPGDLVHDVRGRVAQLRSAPTLKIGMTPFASVASSKNWRW